MNVIYIVGFVTGILYIVFDFIYESISYYVIFKPMPILSISSYTFSRNNYIITIGLLFGSLGDIFLIYENDLYFKLGLGSFLIGHIFYLIYFFNNARFNKVGAILSIIIFIVSMGVTFIIFPKLQNDLIMPVGIYIFVIMVMAISASFYNIYTAIGAVLFLISDSIIAINKFVFSIPLSSLWIMILYYLGQWGIGYGACKKRSEF